MTNMDSLEFDINNTNKLFKYLTDVIMTIFETGLPYVKIDDIQNDLSQIYLKKGFELIKDGCMPTYVEVILEYYLYKILKENEVPNYKLVELIIIKKVIPIIQIQNLESFLELCEHFCSPQIKTQINKQLNKYLPENHRSY